MELQATGRFAMELFSVCLSAERECSCICKVIGAKDLWLLKYAFCCTQVEGKAVAAQTQEQVIFTFRKSGAQCV